MAYRVNYVLAISINSSKWRLSLENETYLCVECTHKVSNINFECTHNISNVNFEFLNLSWQKFLWISTAND